MNSFDFRHRLILSCFAKVPNFVTLNKRYGHAGRRKFVTKETREYEQALLDELESVLIHEQLKPKQFYRVIIGFVGDFYSTEDFMRNGYKPRLAVGNMGKVEYDLDNMLKATIDVVKKVIINDDRWIVGINAAKIQYPQNPGVLIEVYRADILEVADLNGVHPSTVSRIAGP